MADHQLDARGLACPLPILRARQALEDIGPGETLEVLSTDPASEIDFRAFCRATGLELLGAGDLGDGVFRFVLKTPG